MERPGYSLCVCRAQGMHAWNGLVIVCVSVGHKGYTMERPGYSLCGCRAQGVYYGTAWL